MGDKNYRENLKNQIKEACGKVIYTYTAHHKLADRLEREDKCLKSWQIILTAASSGGFLAYVVAHDDRFIWLAAAASFVSLALNLYSKEYKKQNGNYSEPPHFNKAIPLLRSKPDIVINI